MPLMMIERTIKMKLKKLFRALALCTAGVLACAVLTACGDKGDSSSQTSAADTDKKFVITLYAMTHLSPARISRSW